MTNPLRRIATIAFAFVMAVSSINLSGVLQLSTAHAANGNNGTLKIHEFGTPAGTESQDPKACTFNFEGFGFDPGQSGYIVVQPQPGSAIMLQMPFGPATAGGEYVSPYVNDGGAYTLASGHYKVNVFGKQTGNPALPDLNDEKAKSKVFKVECAANTPVTATAPTKVDLCGTANDSYTIPATTGVTYQINGQDVLEGTYPATGNITVTAVAAQGYALQGASSWTLTFNTTGCIVNVTPSAPAKTDLCGVANDTYTIPATTGVTYRVNGVVKPAGTYAGSGLLVITASANAGYTLQGTKSWALLFTNLPCVVTPAAPTKSDVCGTLNDTYTIPATTGVKYYVNGAEKAAGTYNAPHIALIAAVAQPGYIIDIHSQALWLFTFSNKKCPEPCHGIITLKFFGNHDWNDDEDCIPVQVSTSAPTKIDTCGINGDTYTIPVTNGVVYKVNGVLTPAGTYAASGSVTITAHAADSGYVIANGQTTSWTFDFTNETCPKADIGIIAECTAGGVLVKLINSGDADGAVYVNGDKVVVAEGAVEEVTVPTLLYKASVEVLDADKKTVLLDQAYDCTPGRGNAGGPTDTPTVPAKLTSVQMPGTDLPVTGSDSAKQVLMMFLLGISVYGVTYFLQGRRKLSENE